MKAMVPYLARILSAKMVPVMVPAKIMMDATMRPSADELTSIINPARITPIIKGDKKILIQ